MRLVTLTALITATAGLALSQPSHQHRHAHLHHAKRHPNPAEATVFVYELNGKVISKQEVDEGLSNGTLIMSPSGEISQAGAPVPAPAPAPAPVPVSAPAPAPAPVSAAGDSNVNAGSNGGSVSLTATGMNSDFPDGQLDCSEFPSKYGAVNAEWLGLGGWTGIQSGSVIGNAIGNIRTAISSECSGSDCCSEGSYCSYACPPGFQKAQWPTMQGTTGQSIGGILCQNGKLHLTNPSSSKLCMTGTANVKVQVQNKMGQMAAICRTDYPGTEGETVPLDSQPGTIEPLTCPDAANYYNWQGKQTSAQYYVNPAGISVQQACQWGSPDNDWGNFAPLNFGVGYSGGAAWLSIFQNKPTTFAKLNYKVELIGDTMVGRCKYENGVYCSGENYENCNSSGDGCTVSVPSGTVTYVLSES